MSKHIRSRVVVYTMLPSFFDTTGKSVQPDFWDGPLLLWYSESPLVLVMARIRALVIACEPVLHGDMLIYSRAVATVNVERFTPANLETLSPARAEAD